MKEKIAVKPKRSNYKGYKPHKPYKKGTSLLLSALIEKHGGVCAIARGLGMVGQHLTNWRLDGWVPMKWVGKVSKFLNEDKYALNYRGMKALSDGEAPSWQEVVKGCGLDKDVEAKILKGTPPE